MSKRLVKSSFICLLIIAYIISYKLFIFKNYMKYSELITASFLVVLLGLSIKLLGFRKDKTTVLSKMIMKTVLFYLGITFITMYTLGFFIGFNKCAYSQTLSTMFDNIFGPIMIIILVEILRYVFIWANRDKKSRVFIFTALLILFEVIISFRIANSKDLSELFSFFASKFLPVVVKNIVLSYICYHVGYKTPLIYRIIMDVIYVYILPIVPSLGEYVEAMIFISLPILIYISSFGLVDEKIQKPEPVFNTKNFTMLDIPVAVFLITLIALISGFFPHYMIGIGSESMEPVIKKGDAVILKKVKKNQVLKKDDIIAYGKDKLIIVHRIVEVHNNNGVVTYVTKGDANNGNDGAEVAQKNVKGIVEFKIPYIAYPTVWLTELFKK